MRARGMAGMGAMACLLLGVASGCIMPGVLPDMCGDGLVNENAGEECDEKGTSATCDIDCTLAVCGDGMVNAMAGEECDTEGSSASCDEDCTIALCGDGTVNALADESCDDGNVQAGDGCNAPAWPMRAGLAASFSGRAALRAAGGRSMMPGRCSTSATVSWTWSCLPGRSRYDGPHDGCQLCEIDAHDLRGVCRG